MDTNTPTHININLTDVPFPHLLLLEDEACRRGWTRLAMIRYVLAQYAKRLERAEQRRQQAEKVTA